MRIDDLPRPAPSIASDADRYSAMIGLFHTHRARPATERVAIVRRYGLLAGAPALPLAANDAVFSVADAALERQLAGIARAMQEPAP